MYKTILLSLLTSVLLTLSNFVSGQTKTTPLKLEGFNNIKTQLQGSPGQKMFADSFQIQLINFSSAQESDLVTHTTFTKYRKEENLDTTYNLGQQLKAKKLDTVTIIKGKHDSNTYMIQLHKLISDLNANDSVIIHFSVKAGNLASYKVVATDTTNVNPQNQQSQANQPGSGAKPLATLLQQIQFKIQLPNPNLGNWTGKDSADPGNPQNGFYMNRIIYLWDKNLTFFWDKNGDLHMVGAPSKKLKNNLKNYALKDYNFISDPNNDKAIDVSRNIKVSANSPLSLEIMHVNPTDFSVQITDTAIRYNTDTTGSLIGMLFPGGNTAFSGQFTNQQQQAAPNDIHDSIRVATSQYLKQLQQFLYNLQHASKYFQNTIVFYQIRARENIDSFFSATFVKPPMQDFNSYLMQEDTVKADTIMIKQFVQDYNALPTSYYANTAQIPSVDGSYDEYRFNFKIQAKPNSPYPSSSTDTSIAIKAYVIGGFKVDVSSGLYYSGFTNDQYNIRADSTSTTTSSGTDSVSNRGGKLYKENPGKGEFGFVSFLHFYPKISPNFSISFDIGAGVSLASTPQTRYFTGIGFLFGKQNRLAVNAGDAFGNVNKLSSQYFDSTHNLIMVSQSEVGKAPSYTKHLEAHPFISLTYNIASLKKKSSTKTVSPPSSNNTGTNSTNNSNTPATPATNTPATGGQKSTTGGGGSQ